MGEHAGMSRKDFLKAAGAAGIGAAAGLGGVAAKPRAVRAQLGPVTIRLSEYPGIVGDGRDETRLIRAAIRDSDVLIVDNPGGNKRYGFNGTGIPTGSNQEIRGEFADPASWAPFVRVLNPPPAAGEEADLTNSAFELRNLDGTPGVDNVNIHHIRILGQGRSERVLADAWDNTTQDDRMAGAAFAGQQKNTVFDASAVAISNNVTIADVYVDEWPGQVLKFNYVKGIYLTRVRSNDHARGGLVLGDYVNVARLTDCNIVLGGDDAHALNGGEHGRFAPDPRHPDLGNRAHDVEFSGCRGNTRPSKIDSGGGNSGIAIRGARDVRVLGCFHARSQKHCLDVKSFNGYRCANVLVKNTELRDAGWSGIGVETHATDLIRILDNTIDGARDYGTYWEGLGPGPVQLSQCEDLRNAIVGAVAGKHKRVNLAAGDPTRDW